MDTNIYKVVEIQGKGRGLVAMRDLKRGDEIFSEEPIFVVGMSTFRNELCLDLSDSYIDNCLDLVTKEQKEAFDSLANSMDGTYPQRPNTGRYLTNNLPLQRSWVSKKDATKSGIFIEASRVNHSCRPNANWYWNSKTGKGSLFAIRDIPAGTEIVRSYFKVTNKTMRQRQKICYESWNFNCYCPLCSLSTIQTTNADKSFRKVRELEVALNDYTRIKAAPQACLADALMIHRILVMYFPVTTEFAQILFKAFEITAYHGDRVRAAGFLEGILETCCNVEGLESQNVKYFEQVHRTNIEYYRFFGKSDKWASAEEDNPGLREGSGEWLEWLWRFGNDWHDSGDDDEYFEKDKIEPNSAGMLSVGEARDQKKGHLTGDDSIADKKGDLAEHQNLVDKKSNLALQTVVKTMESLTVDTNVIKEGQLLAKKN